MSRRIPDSVRRAVFARDDDRCLHCGLTEGLTIQHRINKGHGGRKSLDNPANLITLCGLSNQLLEADSRRAQAGRDHGWKLSDWEDPPNIPVLDVLTGQWWTLNDNFERIETKERAAA